MSTDISSPERGFFRFGWWNVGRNIRRVGLAQQADRGWSLGAGGVISCVARGEPENMSLSPGKTLSHYRLLGEIGRGGMGVVYEAVDTSLDRRVALKILPAEATSDPDRLERFRREAKAVAALNHPSIVTIYSVEVAEGIHFLTMELVSGKTLHELIPE